MKNNKIDKYLNLLESDIDIINSQELEQINFEDFIKLNFLQIVENSGISIRKIKVAYILGSYSRRTNTKFSDIDLDFYTTDIKDDIVFKYKGFLISIFVYPLKEILSTFKSPENIIWYYPTMNESTLLYDKGKYNKLVKSVINESYNNFQMVRKSLNYAESNIRRIIEYRRKIFSIYKYSDNSKPLINIYLLDFLKKFVDNYIFLKIYHLNLTIASEKSFYNVLLSLDAKITFSIENILNSTIAIENKISDINFIFSDAIKTVKILSTEV